MFSGQVSEVWLNSTDTIAKQLWCILMILNEWIELVEEWYILGHMIFLYNFSFMSH